MAKHPNVSAGLLLFRRNRGELEVLLAHPGGRFWEGRETGIHPEGPFLPLGSLRHVRQKAGKLVHAWVWEGEADPQRARSNVMRAEWPRGSGRWLTFPEVDVDRAANGSMRGGHGRRSTLRRQS
jgi:predicted NUDIX family NTP pyrophosphohydrolase